MEIHSDVKNRETMEFVGPSDPDSDKYHVFSHRGCYYILILYMWVWERSWNKKGVHGES